MYSRYVHILCPLLLVVLAGCEITGPVPDSNELELSLPVGFPYPLIPEYNILTEEKVALGEQLFFDPILSGDQSVSCSSCHLPELAFTDGKAVSIGIEGKQGIRNSPSLLNVAYQNLLFWDGGSLTLEAQALAPLESEVEMDASLEDVLNRLSSHSIYPQAFMEVFGEGPAIRTMVNALAAYQRTLISTGSRYDDFKAGDSLALLPEERMGLSLFEGKAGCASCHSGHLLSNLQFINNGLAPSSADSGRARITGLAEDFARFKVPSLRNVMTTFPYMHDGRFTTLEQVLNHYNKGGAEVRGKDPRITALGLNEMEKQAIIAFLATLTDK